MKNKSNISIGGIAVDECIEILSSLDRLNANPFFPERGFIMATLEKYGFLTFMVFVCPKMQMAYLDTETKEYFMPVSEPSDGLIFSRIPKLRQLVSGLLRIGIPSRLSFVIGDNGYDVYKAPVLGVSLDQEKLNWRRQLYEQDLLMQLAPLFSQPIEVMSLGLMEVGLYEEDLQIPQDMLIREVDFQQWAFAKYYSGKVPSALAIEQIVCKKISAYAQQGFLIEAADAILIATEGTELDSWLQRTQMFQVAGAKFPSIYPYIRQEVLNASIS